MAGAQNWNYLQTDAAACGEDGMRQHPCRAGYRAPMTCRARLNVGLIKAVDSEHVRSKVKLRDRQVRERTPKGIRTMGEIHRHFRLPPVVHQQS
ncbi:hypothetical protein GCM10027280_26650 [Micromonospora polyrhachis]